MQEKNLAVAVFFSFLILTSCSNNSRANYEKASKEVWEVVKAYNKTWSELEDINERLKYVHDDVVFI